MKSTVLIIWQAHLRSTRNAVRHDTKTRLALSVSLAFNLVIGLWSASQLSSRIAQWQAIGPRAVETGLWSLCLLAWSGMSFFALLGCVRQTFSHDEMLLLLPLPIAPATRFRALYGLFFLQDLWAWLLLEVGVTGYVLVSTLGWHALVWLLLLQSGVGVAVLSTLLVVLLVMRYLLPRGQMKTRLVSAATFMLVMALVLLLALLLKRSVDAHNALLWLRPEFACVLCVLLLAVMLGPLAASIGKLYTAAFQIVQSWDRSRKAVTLPGIRSLTNIFARHRTLIGALWVKAVLNQSRNWFFWARLGMVAVIVWLFPFVRTALAHYGFPDDLLVIGYTGSMVILDIAEVAGNAISGEANRLTLYLTAPLDLSRFLRAKLILFLLPLLGEGVLIGLFLGWRQGLALGQFGFVLVADTLIIVGIITLLVLGSTWDEDLNLTVEGAAQALLMEEAAASPRRIWLFNLAMVLFALMFLVLWKLPVGLALVALALIDSSIVVGMWRFGQFHLRACFVE